MKTPCVSDVEGELVVGQFYMVPSVRDRSNQWWPVLGPKHDDKEYLNFPEQHYHYDLRFYNDALLRHIISRSTWPDAYALISVRFTSRLLEEGRTQLRRFKCRRAMPDFPIHFPEGHKLAGEVVRWFPMLEKAYSKQRVNCQRCPHRGLPLNGLPVKDGVVVCPGHGLAWRVETGEMVHRAPVR